jgi:hypothetical protein
MKTSAVSRSPLAARRLLALSMIGSLVATFAVPSVTEAATKKKATKTKASAQPTKAAAETLRTRSVGKGALVSPSSPVPDIVVPSPPTPRAALTGSAPDMVNSAREALAKATTADERASIWLSIYAAAGIPVLDESGTGIGTGSIDPIGPPWWMVWSMSAARTDQGISLSDFARAMAPRGAGDAAAASMVADLRAQADSSNQNPASRFVARFVGQRTLSTSKGIYDPSFNPATSRIDMATAQFFLWALTRGSLRASLKAGMIKAPANISSKFYLSALPAQAAADIPGVPPKKCSELFGDEQTTFITNFVLNKFAVSGIALPGGIDLPTFSSNFAKLLDTGSDESVLGQVGKFEKKLGAVTTAMGRVNAVFSLLSFILQYSGISLAGVAPELIRTKNTNAGAAIIAEVEIWYSLPKAMKGIPDGASKLGCALNTLSNALGVGATLPSEGPMGGVEVEVGPGKGFGRMMFNFIKFRQTADENGHVDVPLIGRPQKKKIPNPTPVNYRWSIRVHSTTDPVDGAALFNFFFDSFSAVGTLNPLAGVGAVVDFLKLTSFDLGELEGPLIDWEDGEEPCQVKGGNFLAGGVIRRFC